MLGLIFAPKDEVQSGVEPPPQPNKQNARKQEKIETSLRCAFGTTTLKKKSQSFSNNDRVSGLDGNLKKTKEYPLFFFFSSSKRGSSFVIFKISNARQ